VLNLQAIPADGWIFDKWIAGSEEFKDPALQIIIDQNLTILAVFSEVTISDPDPETTGGNPNQDSGTPPPSSTGPEPQPAPVVSYNFMISKQGEGTIEPTAGSHQYTKDTEVKLKAVPASGWRFQKWIIDDTELNSPETKIIITSNRQAVAYFVKVLKGI